MRTRLVYLRLELKRAWKRFPHMMAGAIALLLLVGAAALLSARALYGERAVGRVAVGVILPEGDGLARQAVSMLSSLDSVESLCDFKYMDREEALRQLEKGQVYAVMEVPPQFVEDIINGKNTPVQVILPQGGGVESRIFMELTEAGAATLEASQAGIYAGDQLLEVYSMEHSIPQLEADLNRVYMKYSLPREDYFKMQKVSATGDVDTICFYGISAFVFLLVLCPIPISPYLLPQCRTIKGSLGRIGIGAGTRAASRILGVGSMIVVIGICLWTGGLMFGRYKAGMMESAAIVLVCLSIASFVVCLYEIAGTITGGGMFLFLSASSMHFLAGGFLPLVFLPESLRVIAPIFPSFQWMEGIKMAVTGEWDLWVFARLILIALIGFLFSMGAEVIRE